jgi:hypothetical protein
MISSTSGFHINASARDNLQLGARKSNPAVTKITGIPSVISLRVSMTFPDQ